MKMPWTLPWVFFPGKSAPAKPLKRTCLAVESLEDRLVLATTTAALSHDAWAGQSFHLDDVAVFAPQLIEPGQNVQSQDEQAHRLIGLNRAYADYPYRGDGYSVAVIDSGIDYRHSALGGAWGTRVIAGWDFVNNDADPLDDNGHGTHVAGIIGSSAANFPGVAPNVNLIALKVLATNGKGTFGNVESALQWVEAHRAQYNIAAINLSLGSGNYSVNPFEYMEDEFQALTQKGVFIAIAAGNSYYTYGGQPGLAFPATSPAVVSVGAVWSGDFGSKTWLSGAQDLSTAADRITSFSQRDAGLGLLAPGAMITSTHLHGQYSTLAGTSMASPMVAGAAVLVHQALDVAGRQAEANQSTILDILRRTGAVVQDGDDENDNVIHTGLSFRRIDVGAALASIGVANPNPPTPGTNQPPVLNPIGEQKVKPGQSVVVPLPASDPDGHSLKYTAQVEGPSSEAFALKQRLGLFFGGSYFEDNWGAKEKWLLGNAGTWYCLLPNGDLRLFAGNMADTLQPANLIAALGVGYYDDPALLWEAAAPIGPDVALVVAGGQLRITPATTYSGSFQVRVTVSDGQASASRTFGVTVTNSAPVFQGLADIAFKPNQTASINLSATDADADSLSFGARLGGNSLLAVQLKQKLGLSYLGSYRVNSRGAGEKWLGGAGASYLLLPTGELRRWAGNLNATFGSAKNLVATLDASFYHDPRKLWNPVQPAIGVVGNRLTIAPPAGFSGSFVVEMSVTDGQVVTRQNITVTVSSQAPGVPGVTVHAQTTKRPRLTPE